MWWPSWAAIFMSCNAKAWKFKCALVQKEESCRVEREWNVNFLQGLLSDEPKTSEGKVTFREYDYRTGQRKAAYAHAKRTHNFCANACWKTRTQTHLRAFAHIWCVCFLLLFTLIYGILLLLLSTKGKTKGSSNKHHWKYLRQQKNSRYVLGHAHGVGVQLLVIDKRPSVTQIFLLWTECKRKQSQPSILCYISLCCCCLSLLSFAGLARNKEKNLHNTLKFSCTAELFQSQTVQSLQCLRVSGCVISQCKSCQIFRFYRSFSFYESG